MKVQLIHSLYNIWLGQSLVLANIMGISSICTSLVTDDIDDLLMCLFAICIFSFRKCFAQSLMDYLLFKLAVILIFWVQVLYQIHDLKIFLSFCVFPLMHIFNFHEVQCVGFSFVLCAFRVAKRSLLNAVL